MTADEALAITQAQVNENGQDVSIRRYTGTGAGRPSADTATKGFVRNYGADELVGAITQGDQVAIVLVDTLSGIFPLTTNDKLVVNNREFAIKNLMGRVVAGTLIAIEIHAMGPASVGQAAGADTTPPTITSSSTRNNAENSTLSHALTANESVTWSIVGGADQARFEISGSTLRWLGNGTKDYETPDDAGANNAYVVQVRATDGSSNTTDQTITVTVTDVAEGLAVIQFLGARFNLARYMAVLRTGA